MRSTGCEPARPCASSSSSTEMESASPMKTLGEEGWHYFENRLANAHTLSRLLLEQLSAESVDVVALVPSGTGLPKSHNLAWGGVMSADRGFSALLSVLPEFLVESEDVLIVEDALSSPGDPWLSEARSPHFSYRGEVYFFAIGSGHEAIEDALWSGTTASGVVFAASRRSSPTGELAPSGDVTLKTLEEFARNVRLVGVDILDGESYALVRHRG